MTIAWCCPSITSRGCSRSEMARTSPLDSKIWGTQASSARQQLMCIRWTPSSPTIQTTYSHQRRKAWFLPIAMTSRASARRLAVSLKYPELHWFWTMPCCRIGIRAWPTMRVSSVWHSAHSHPRVRCHADNFTRAAVVASRIGKVDSPREVASFPWAKAFQRDDTRRCTRWLSTMTIMRCARS